jgi:hypothetical protein
MPDPRTTRTHAEASPFATLERAFATLTTEPRPLALDGTGIPGLPPRSIPLDELRARLLHPSARYATRDAALEVLIGRAHAERGAWIVGLAGVLLPGLRRAITPLVAACPGKEADLQAETLTGLLVAVDRCSPGRARPAGFLCGRAFDAAKRLLRAELAERARPGHDPVSAEPPKPFGHPDFVLARAVAEGAVCADDAELIGATRLGEMSLADAAVSWGLTYKAAERRRHRAETALVAWIHDGFVAEGAVPAGSKGAGRPRQGHRPDQRPGFRPPTEPPTTPRR